VHTVSPFMAYNRPCGMNGIIEMFKLLIVLLCSKLYTQRCSLIDGVARKPPGTVFKDILNRITSRTGRLVCDRSMP
jgi:hypothetical protein